VTVTVAVNNKNGLQLHVARKHPIAEGNENGRDRILLSESFDGFTAAS
jgi:hypothetical protein